MYGKKKMQTSKPMYAHLSFFFNPNFKKSVYLERYFASLWKNPTNRCLSVKIFVLLITNTETSLELQARIS